MGQPFGALVVPGGSRIGGEELERERFPALHGAVLAATIDANPILIGADDTGNSGHATATAENAKMFGHPLTGELSYVIRTGAMVTVLQWRSSEPGRPLPKINPPTDLPEPMFFSFDAEYAGALHDALSEDTDEARRLALAIDWLNIAWSNNDNVSARTRTLAYRSALEALLGGEASTKKQREALSALLDDPGAPKRLRRWTEHNGKDREAQLTDLEWWFQSFSLLRNRISHGDVIGTEGDDWTFDDGEHHLRHADAVLRRAIKRTIIHGGADPLLEETPHKRTMIRAVEELFSEEAEGG
ncbi:MAG TPA: hypothetical protein VHU24_10310 [Solirubrobacterales bacterium]|jgi:hypothetical protein|nr:hypothetical protein [Solirubrobacterales bacterium]